jgi:hypothetical protein
LLSALWSFFEMVQGSDCKLCGAKCDDACDISFPACAVSTFAGKLEARVCAIHAPEAERVNSAKSRNPLVFLLRLSRLQC